MTSPPSCEQTDPEQVTFVPTPCYDELIRDLGEPGSPVGRLAAAFDRARDAARRAP